MDIVFVALTLIFFAMTWAFLVLCDRLSAGGMSESAHGS
jgi:hypothetical protein